MKATKYIFGWHHWCGLFVGLFLLMMSITGSVLVFSDELEMLEEHDIPAVQAIQGTPSFDASFQSVQKKYPDWEIRLYHLPKADEALVYELRQKENAKKVCVQPVSGEILGVNENANQSIQRKLLLLHYTWFAGTAGKIIVFITGVLFLITLITGLIVYRKSLIKVFTFRVRFNRKTTRSFYSSLHRIIGVWSLIFNLLIVASGLWLSGQIVLNALKTPAITAAKNKEVPPIQSIDAIVKKLNKEYPDFEIHLIRIRPGGNTVQASGRLTNDPLVYGNYYSVVTLNGNTLGIEKSSFMKDMPAGERLKKMAGPLHFGNYGGLPLKIAYCLLGFTPAFLSISGFILWRKRRRVKRHMPAKKMQLADV
jgi:uncharacterized iron-regulated membrane protein